ncbi:hypothetical protein V8G54_011840 [Vigna mungo]|uniref:Uncharacterized protein n=1 Tax=Vigna mungo TaxID=3915 RepID=A0AAQ3S008_VIGMU
MSAKHMQQFLLLDNIRGGGNDHMKFLLFLQKLTKGAEEEKGAETNGAPLIVVVALVFQEIKCPTTFVYYNSYFTDSISALDSANVNSLMSDDCMSAFVDISECVCEPYDHNHTDVNFEKLVDGFRELAVIHDCNSFVVVPISDFTTTSAQLKEQYYEMDFYADVCEPEIDFNVFDHMHDVPVEVVDFTPYFGHSHITKAIFSMDKVHIPASSVFDDCINLNALLDDESDAYDDKYVVFDHVKVGRLIETQIALHVGLVDATKIRWLEAATLYQSGAEAIAALTWAAVEIGPLQMDLKVIINISMLLSCLSNWSTTNISKSY